MLKSKQNPEDILAKLRKEYENQEDDPPSFCIYGKVGTGKTTALSTMPGKGIIFSFDPGGTNSIRKKIDANRIFVDSNYENEDPFKPKVWKAFVNKLDELQKGKVLKHIDWVAIDSGTLLCEACLNFIRGKSNRASQTAQLQDYNEQQFLINQLIRNLKAQGLMVVVTFHVEVVQDKATGNFQSRLLVPGKLAYKIPILFDEIYLCVTEGVGNAIRYKFQTKNVGLFDARSRLTELATKPFQLKEPMDFASLLRKAGLLK